MLHNVVWFGLVGSAAALVHFGVFLLTIPWVSPEVANVLGFAVAFVVSFVGHRILSFSDATTTARQSLGRFAAAALAGFACNGLVFVALLRGLGLPAKLALCVALLVAAGQSFFLSRFWAFRR